MIPSFWCSGCRAILAVVLAIVGLLSWLHLKGFTLAWELSVLVIKSCGGVVKAVVYVLRGGW